MNFCTRRHGPAKKGLCIQIVFFQVVFPPADNQIMGLAHPSFLWAAGNIFFGAGY